MIEDQTTEKAIVALGEMSSAFEASENGKFSVQIQKDEVASVSFWWSDFGNKLETMIGDDTHGIRVFEFRRIDAYSPLVLTRKEVSDGMEKALTKLLMGYALKEKLAGIETPATTDNLQGEPAV